MRSVTSSSRASLFQHLEKSLRHAEQRQRDSDAGQNDMFGHAEIGIKTSKVQNLPEWEDEKKLLGERETLGLYLTGHPIKRYQEELKKITNKTISQLLNSGVNLKESWQFQDDSKTILVAGLLDQIRMRNSPRGRIAFLTLDDNTGRIDVAVFANDYAKYGNLLIKDAILIVKGNLGWDEFTGRPRIRANEIWSFDDYLKQYGTLLNIKIQAIGDSLSFVQNLQQLLLPFKDGNCTVLVEYQNSSVAAQLEFPEDWNISLDGKLLKRLSKVSEVVDTSVIYKKQSINA